MSTTDSKPSIELSGTNGKIELYGSFVRISRKSVLGFLLQGLKGNKDIYFKNISAIQLKKPGLMPGYIQFTLMGGNESKGGVLDAQKDENTVTFNSGKNYDKALQIKEFIEDKMNSSEKGGISSSDEIEKLYSLMEKGIITKKEFEEKKKKLLG